MDVESIHSFEESRVPGDVCTTAKITGTAHKIEVKTSDRSSASFAVCASG